MEASVVDLRYRMKDVLEALERKENVTIIYHGKVKGKIVPVSQSRKQKIADHPFFGMKAKSSTTVLEEMSDLRGDRRCHSRGDGHREQSHSRHF
jgi:antitoxin (DNA-binding transcriptional repressor) of toxin-antitoxin stability system